MTDIRRTVLWVIFSMALVLIWDGWNKFNGQPTFFSPPQTKSSAASSLPASGVPALPSPAGLSATAPSGTLPSGLAQALPASQKIVVKTDLVHATIDTLGGSLTRVELLSQVDGLDAAKKVVLLDKSPERFYVAQTGLLAATGGTLLPNHSNPMRWVSGDPVLQEGQNVVEIKLESPELGGVKLVKTYTFRRGDYVLGVKHEVVNTSASVVQPQLYLQLTRDASTPPGESSLYFTFTGPAVYTDAEKFQKIEFTAIEKGKAAHRKNADNGWVAMVQHYFASAWLLGVDNNDRQPREFFTQKIDSNHYSVGMIVPLGELQPGVAKSQEARLFVGPQEENKLSALAPGLELVKDYGLFTILSKPLFWLLTQLHHFLGNWGWAIVALVVVLKAAFFWLNAYAYRSMAKMKVVNPKILELRERLKDKPQQMQQEMMRIYKAEGVNPVGGCLPILVQMPFFIALYWVLLSSVEMRNVPWIGWITDLSAKDPYFILPLLMTVSSLVQTWLNPTPADPMQAKMMWLMPLVFSVMFFFFPAGLVLYWLTNNILSIAQQYVINRSLGVAGK
jgi:YidC/Oxa1 family membrane protein insertase